jgi:outer membrane protein assembly factor BamD (BamD/ComL family)
VRAARAASAEGSDVRDQIRMIDEARAAMDHHDPSTALLSVDRYAAKYPEGMFRQEARILRILALDDRGDHGRATTLARAFVTSYPTSAHVARIERIADR